MSGCTELPKYLSKGSISVPSENFCGDNSILLMFSRSDVYAFRESLFHHLCGL
jgi:hypothetical protein